MRADGWRNVLRLPVIGMLLLLGACQSSERVSREQMLERIDARSRLPDSHYDLLWYQGTSRNRHYLKHIRGYFLDEVVFIVDVDQLPIAQPRAYSRDSSRWLRIGRIGERWQAARRHPGQSWQRDRCAADQPCLHLD